MPTGGLHPTPDRTGRSARGPLEVMVRALLDGRGTAYDDGNTTLVYAETMAIGRAVNAAWSCVRRLANQFDPRRMTDFLPRWEKILGISPAYGSTDIARRAAVAAKLGHIGLAPTLQGVTDTLRTALPSTFSSIVTNASATAVTWIAAGATIPGGVTVAATPMDSSGAYTGPTWSSTVSEMPVKLASPSWMTAAQFYREADGINAQLDDFLPAWTTFFWFRDDPTAGAGFFLDAANPPTTTIPNLDNMRLDS